MGSNFKPREGEGPERTMTISQNWVLRFLRTVTTYLELCVIWEIFLGDNHGYLYLRISNRTTQFAISDNRPPNCKPKERGQRELRLHLKLVIRMFLEPWLYAYISELPWELPVISSVSNNCPTVVQAFKPRERQGELRTMVVLDNREYMYISWPLENPRLSVPHFR
jgi:hypothetical protein